MIRSRGESDTLIVYSRIGDRRNVFFWEKRAKQVPPSPTNVHHRFPILLSIRMRCRYRSAPSPTNVHRRFPLPS